MSSDRTQIALDHIAEAVTAAVLRAIDMRQGGGKVGGFDIHRAGGRFEFFVDSGQLGPGGLPQGPGGGLTEGGVK
jgi:hypothetical protein